MEAGRNGASCTSSAWRDQNERGAALQMAFLLPCAVWGCWGRAIGCGTASSPRTRELARPAPGNRAKPSHALRRGLCLVRCPIKSCGGRAAHPLWTPGCKMQITGKHLVSGGRMPKVAGAGRYFVFSALAFSHATNGILPMRATWRPPSNSAAKYASRNATASSLEMKRAGKTMTLASLC